MGSQISGKEHAQRWSIAWEEFVFYKIIWNSFGSELFAVLTHREGIWLSEEIGHQFLVVCNNLIFEVDMSLRLGESNEFRWDNSSLVHELIETMLTVGARFTENNRTCLDSGIVSYSTFCHAFTIAFHI